LVLLENRVGHARGAVVVGKKVSKRAVTRNRIKRLTRAAFASLFTRLPAIDIIIHVRPMRKDVYEYQAIAQALEETLNRAKVLKS